MPVSIARLLANQRYQIIQRLLSLGSTARTAEAINELVDAHPDWGWEKITHWHIYPLMNDEYLSGNLVYLPPIHEQLADAIARTYQLELGQLCVVDVRGLEARQAIADKAAQTVFNLIREVERARAERPVHLGFAGGDLVSMTVQSLARLLERAPRLPDLALHSLTAGFDPGRPETDPNTFSTYFKNVRTSKTYHCIYSSPIVGVKGYREVLKSEGVRSSYQARTEIDIVITGMGSADDPHSQLQRFHASASRRPDPRWVGEVGWLPYGASGPAARSNGIRGVALFELHELVELARTPGKYVVLVAGSCGECLRPKGAALRPLLTEPSLRCWTHLLLELDSAQEVVTPPVRQPMRRARRTRKAKLRKDADAERA